MLLFILQNLQFIKVHVAEVWESTSNTPSGNTAGYFGGGQIGAPVVSSITGIRFSDDTIRSPSATLAAARRNLGGVNTAFKGYWGSGEDASATLVNELDGLVYATETATNPAATFANRTTRFTCSSYKKGYWLRSQVGGVTQHDALDFVTEATSTVGLGFDTVVLAGISCPVAYNPSDAYAEFGDASQPSVEINYKFSMINESTAQAGLSLGFHQDPVGFASFVKGYFAGGQQYNVTLTTAVPTISIDSLDFATLTTATESAILVMVTGNSAGLQSFTKGYVQSGQNIDTFVFASSTVVTMGSALAADRSGAGGVSSTRTPASSTLDASAVTFSYGVSQLEPGAGFGGNVAGYVGGGSPSNGGVVSADIDGILFSTDAVRNPSAALATARNTSAGTNTAFKGYWMDGFASNFGAGVNQIDGIVFATEAANNPAAALSIHGYQGGSSSYSNGYTFGGSVGSSTTIEKFKFLDESTASVTATLSAAAQPRWDVVYRPFEALVLNGSFTTDIFNHDTETRDTSATIGPWANRIFAAAFASTAKGFVAGGENGDPTRLFSIASTNWATRANITESASLSVARERAAALQSFTKGYVADGLGDGSASALTSTEVFTFGTGAVSALGASLTTARMDAVGVSSVSSPASVAESSTATLIPGGTTQTASQTESGTSTATQTAAATFVAAKTETATAADTKTATATFVAAKTESATATATATGVTGGATLTAAQTESGSAQGTQTATANFSVTRTEAGSAQGSQAVQVTFAAFKTESASAQGSQTASANFSATRTEAASAVDTKTVIVTFVASKTETAAPVDTKTSTASFTASKTETATPVDTSSRALVIPVTRTETASPVDTKTATASFTASKTESASAVDTKTVQAAFTASKTESASAVGTQTVTAVFTVTRSEPASALDTKTATAVFTASKTETGSPVDTKTATASFTATRTESASATDLVLQGALVVASQTETGSAQGTQAGIRSANVAQSETGNAQGTQTSQASFSSTRTESASAVDTKTATTSVSVSKSETGNALASQTGQAAFTASRTESSPVTATATATKTLTATKTETGNAVATVTAQAVLNAVKSEAASATDAATAQSMLVAFITQTAIANAVQFAIVSGNGTTVVTRQTPNGREKVMIHKGSTKILTFFMIDSLDHMTGSVGKTVTVSVSKNGGAFASPEGAVTEVGFGWYAIALTANDTNVPGMLTFHAEAPGCDSTDWSDQVIVGDIDNLDQRVSSVSQLVAGLAP